MINRSHPEPEQLPLAEIQRLLDDYLESDQTGDRLQQLLVQQHATLASVVSGQQAPPATGHLGESLRDTLAVQINRFMMGMAERLRLAKRTGVPQDLILETRRALDVLQPYSNLISRDQERELLKVLEDIRL